MSTLLCEVQRSTGDNGKMSKIRVVTPHRAPIWEICGIAILF